MLSTFLSEREALGVGELFHCWQPLIAIFSFPPRLPRKERKAWLAAATGERFDPSVLARYSVTHLDRRHEVFGGVSQARWSFAHYSRVKGGIPRAQIMMASTFSRPLQTALDDTLGGANRAVFDHLGERDSDTSIIGHVRPSGSKERYPVYDAQGLAPDVGNLASTKRQIWVYAESVFGRKGAAGKRVVRQIDSSEVLSIWDYEGKLEARRWGTELRRAITNARLRYQ